MKFLFVADPVENLKPASDTSLAILRAALARKHSVFWATDEGLELGRVWAASVESCAADGLPKISELAWFPMTTFHGVWIRKDPPFDTSYVRLCWLLSLSEPKVAMWNSPAKLIRYHEKLLPLEAHAQGFLAKNEVLPSFIGPAGGARQFIRELKAEVVVTKPFLGFGGGGVRKHTLEEFSRLSDKHLADSVVQPFLPEITEVGDRRVFFIDGKYVGDFVRMPKAGDFISNLAYGGTGHSVPLSKKERKVVDKVGKFLKKIGVEFAGADFIGHRVSEINITSPTGLRKLEELEGRDLSVDLVKLAESRVKKRRT